MSALAKFLNLLADRIEDPTFERTFVPAILPQWELHKGEVLKLLEDFEGCMSPRLLFQSPPLSDCDAQARRWLAEVVHTLWLKRGSVREIVAGAISAVERVDEAYLYLKRELRRCQDLGSTDSLRPLYKDFAKFREHCQHLAIAVEKLPNGIIVT